MQVFVIINKDGIRTDAYVNIWNPSNCKCECDKSCDNENI